MGSHRHSDEEDVNILAFIKNNPSLLTNPISANGQDLTLSVPLQMDNLITNVFYTTTVTSAGRDSLVQFPVNAKSDEPLCWQDFHTADQQLFQSASAKRIQTLYLMLGSTGLGYNIIILLFYFL